MSEIQTERYLSGKWFIYKLLAGEYTVRKTFLLHALLIPIVIYLILLLLLYPFLNDLGYLIAKLAGYSYALLGCVGLWRASNKNKDGLGAWIYFAQIYSILGFVFFSIAILLGGVLLVGALSML